MFRPSQPLKPLQPQGPARAGRLEPGRSLTERHPPPPPPRHAPGCFPLAVGFPHGSVDTSVLLSVSFPWAFAGVLSLGRGEGLELQKLE